MKHRLNHGRWLSCMRYCTIFDTKWKQDNTFYDTRSLNRYHIVMFASRQEDASEYGVFRVAICPNYVGRCDPSCYGLFGPTSWQFVVSICLMFGHSLFTLISSSDLNLVPMQMWSIWFSFTWSGDTLVVLCIFLCVNMLPPMVMLFRAHVSANLSVLVHLSYTMGSHHFFISVVVHFNLRIEISHENDHIIFFV